MSISFARLAGGALLLRLGHEALRLEDFGHVLDLHEHLERDDHEHQLRLVDLVVEAIQEWQPEQNERDQNYDHEDDEDCDLGLELRLKVRLNRIAQRLHELPHEVLSDEVLDDI
jgi:hypothetical protein